MSALFRLVHDTFEGPNLVVRHVFYGKTVEEARAVYEAHRKTDAFLRECDDRNNFEGKFACTTRWIMVSPGHPLPPEP